MSYKITLKATPTANPFSISFKAPNRRAAEKGTREIYPEHIILNIIPGSCI